MHQLLIVDDEVLIRRGIRSLIERIAPDWQVAAEAGNGQEALQLVKEQAFDLILSDIRMPVMDGLDMQEQLYQAGCRIPLVFLTGFDEFEYVQRALRVRAYDFLLKPVYDEDVLRILEAFKRDFTSLDKGLPKAVPAKLKQFEFELLNTLESFDTCKMERVLATHRLELEPYFSELGFVQEVVRIAGGFLLKQGCKGYDWYSIRSGAYVDMNTVIHVLKRQIEMIKEQDAQQDKVIEKAKAYILQHIDASVTLAEVAKAVHLNMNYFSEYFREKTGETFSQFVIRSRMEEAKRMLMSPEVKVQDIADRLGYENPRYFSRAFKQLVGMTPKEYREQHSIQ